MSQMGFKNNLPDASAAAMTRVHDGLKLTYPKVHAHATREFVADYSLLYHIAGSDTALKPAMYLCHLDVVPVEPGTEGSWTHPPFSGTIDDTFVWGAYTMSLAISTGL